MIKISANTVANGVVTGLVIAAVIALCISAWRSWQTAAESN
jgi:hypothetical protein